MKLQNNPNLPLPGKFIVSTLLGVILLVTRIQEYLRMLL